MSQADWILVVEDDATLGGLLCDLLRAEGYDARRVEDGGEALRRVEWRQLLPTEQERQDRQLKLTIRFEGKILAEDRVSGHLEATMRGALSGLDKVRLYSSLGKRRGDWRGAAIRTRIEADFELSLRSIRYQDVLIVREHGAIGDENNADPFRVIPNDERERDARYRRCPARGEGQWRARLPSAVGTS